MVPATSHSQTIDFAEIIRTKREFTSDENQNPKSKQDSVRNSLGYCNAFWLFSLSRSGGTLRSGANGREIEKLVGYGFRGWADGLSHFALFIRAAIGRL